MAALKIMQRKVAPIQTAVLFSTDSAAFGIGI
jgi:hypothetical protein